MPYEYSEPVAVGKDQEKLTAACTEHNDNPLKVLSWVSEDSDTEVSYRTTVKNHHDTYYEISTIKVV
jgi:hypothetical protein